MSFLNKPVRRGGRPGSMGRPTLQVALGRACGQTDDGSSYDSTEAPLWAAYRGGGREELCTKGGPYLLVSGSNTVEHRRFRESKRAVKPVQKCGVRSNPPSWVSCASIWGRFDAQHRQCSMVFDPSAHEKGPPWIITPSPPHLLS